MLWCRHGGEHAWRLRAGTGRLVGDVPGRWVCDVCHAPASPLVEYGQIEWYDGREVVGLQPMPLRAIDEGQLRIDRSPGYTKLKSAPSEAKGSEFREQAAPDSVGSIEESARAAAPTSKPRKPRAKAKPVSDSEPPSALF